MEMGKRGLVGGYGRGKQGGETHNMTPPLSPQRVRELMAEQRRAFAPPPKPTPSQAVETLETRRKRIVAGWLAIPESGRSLTKHADYLRTTAYSLKRLLESEGVVVRDARQVRIAERVRWIRKNGRGKSLEDMAAALKCDRKTVTNMKKMLKK